MHLFILPQLTGWFDYPSLFIFPFGLLTILMNLVILGLISVIMFINYLVQRRKGAIAQNKKKMVLLYLLSIIFFPVAIGSFYYILIIGLYVVKSKESHTTAQKIKLFISKMLLSLLIILIPLAGSVLILLLGSYVPFLHLIIACIVATVIAIKKNRCGTGNDQGSAEISAKWDKFRPVVYAGLIIFIIFSATVFSFRIQPQFPNSVEEIDNSSEVVPLRVMTYNIRCLAFEKNPQNNWINRRSLLVDYMNTFEADIIGVQEAFYIQLNYIVSNLEPQYGYCGIAREDGAFLSEFAAILYRKDKFEVMDTGTFWLASNPSVPVKTWNSSYTRICTWVRLQHIPSKKQFFVFCAHFDFKTETKTEAAKLIQDVVANYTGSLPVFLMGDFNTRIIEPTFKYLDGYGSKPLNDSYRSVHGEPVPQDYSFSYWNSSYVPSDDRRIDFIFISDNIKAQNISIPKDGYGDSLTYSDHYPVILDCTI